MIPAKPPPSFGRFELMAELGRGSMGIVHRARDPVMGRDVAIKTVLLPHGLPAAQKDEFHARFLREARAAGGLSHPGIVTVYDFNDGVATGCPFIAMEYVEGPTLHDLIDAHGALDPGWALAVGETLADALQAAHDAGIVHRDLKPANILVRQADGVPKISDFGVARVNHSELTVAGTAHGSPAYMAPERVRGMPADARSDLFALAVILYEVLCGHRPFGGDDFSSTCAAILHEEPCSIRERKPALAPACDGFFARALAKDPEERFQTGAAFREALRALRQEQDRFDRGESTRLIHVVDQPDWRTEVRSARVSLVIAASVMALMLVVAILGWNVREPSASGPTSPPQPETLAPAAPKATIAPRPARLDLLIKNRVRGGTLALFVDGEKVYDLDLAQVASRDRDETSAAVELQAGRQILIARFAPVGDSAPVEQSLEFEIAAGATRDLAIVVGRKIFGKRLTLTLE